MSSFRFRSDARLARVKVGEIIFYDSRQSTNGSPSPRTKTHFYNPGLVWPFPFDQFPRISRISKIWKKYEIFCEFFVNFLVFSRIWKIFWNIVRAFIKLVCLLVRSRNNLGQIRKGHKPVLTSLPSKRRMFVSRYWLYSGTRETVSGSGPLPVMRSSVNVCWPVKRVILFKIRIASKGVLRIGPANSSSYVLAFGR